MNAPEEGQLDKCEFFARIFAVFMQVSLSLSPLLRGFDIHCSERDIEHTPYICQRGM
jgi:hypothetical protein